MLAGPNDREGDPSFRPPEIRGLTRSAEPGVPGGHAWTPVGGFRHASPAARPTGMTDSAATLARPAPRAMAGAGTIGLAAFGVAIIAAGVWLPWHSPWPDADPVATFEIAGVVIASLLWLAAALWFRAKDRTRRLWLVLFAMVPASWVWALAFTATPLTYSIGVTFWGIGVPFGIHMLIAFPNGRLEGRIDRWVVALLYLLFLGGWLLRAMTSPTVYDCDPFCGHNVFAVWPDEALHQVVSTTVSAAILILAIPVAIALWQHWRAATPAARRAFLPAILTIPVNAVIAVISTLAIAFRLDIGWVADHGFKVAVAGLIPAALLVGLVQARLERARAASLLVELGHGVPPAGLREALARAVRDPTLELAFPAPDGAGLMDPSGQPFQQPAAGAKRAVARVARGGKLLAVLVHDPAIDAEDPGLVEAVGSAAGLALENARLAAEVRAQLEEVRASRARLAQAADEERRRVERDLHDGAQQRLVALTMRLERARRTAPESAGLIDETLAELRHAISEVRQLARGLMPPILTEAGLAAAVESLAERTPIPVIVAVPDRRFAPSLEAAAYYVVAEALTNADRYAGASEVRIDGRVEDDRLVVTVADDGEGGADPRSGTGLRGLADRVEAAGGTLDVASGVGEGTRVRAAFPLQ
jgi:signal transduction histidine kinase